MKLSGCIWILLLFLVCAAHKGQKKEPAVIVDSTYKYSVAVPPQTEISNRKDNVKMLVIKKNTMVKIIVLEHENGQSHKDIADEYLKSVTSLSRGHKILHSGMWPIGQDSCFNYTVAHRMGPTGMMVSSWCVFMGNEYNYIITYMGDYKLYEKDKKKLDYIVANFKIID